MKNKTSFPRVNPRGPTPPRPWRLPVIPLMAALGLCGCTMLSYTGPNGERFSRGSLGANASVAALAVEADTNGIRRVELKGYRNDSSQAITTVTEAAVRAALRSP